MKKRKIPEMIRISENNYKRLEKKKVHPRQSFDDIVGQLLDKDKE